MGGRSTDRTREAAKRTKLERGDDWFVKLGAKGGAASNSGGFYKRRDLASAAGKIGGLTSRRRGKDGLKPRLTKAWKARNLDRIIEAEEHLREVQAKHNEEHNVEEEL